MVQTEREGKLLHSYLKIVLNLLCCPMFLASDLKFCLVPHLHLAEELFPVSLAFLKTLFSHHVTVEFVQSISVKFKQYLMFVRTNIKTEKWKITTLFNGR